jgi:hypothetical protein
MYRLMRFSALALFLVASVATPALAGVGLHAGLSLDPDDFIIGARFRSHPLEERIFVVPSIEFGFGDATMIAGNLDGHYAFQSSSKYAPYAGAGITLNWFDTDGGSDTEFGGSILGGIQVNEKFYFETKLGLGDVPDWKFVLGWGK